MLRLVTGGTDVDLAGAERAVADLLIALGQDGSDEHTQHTPARVAAAYGEMLSPRAFAFKTFANHNGYDKLVTACDIRFHTLCRHHMLPIRGVAHVGYL